MGLDLHVMPLLRFYSGQYKSAVESALGLEDGTFMRIGTPKPDNPEALARAHVAQLQGIVSRLAGMPVGWHDDGECRLSVQYDYVSFAALQDFAAYQDHPLPLDDGGNPRPFSPGENSYFRMHPSLLKVWHGSPTRFPHIIFHALNQGFYLPSDFPEPVTLPAEEKPALENEEPVDDEQSSDWWASAKRWARNLRHQLLGSDEAKKLLDGFRARLRESIEKEAKQDAEAYKKRLRDLGLENARMLPVDRVGSSVALLRELDALGPVLGMTRDWGELTSGEAAAPEEDPLGKVRYGWSVLHYAARTSVQHGLPIVVDG